VSCRYSEGYSALFGSVCQVFNGIQNGIHGIVLQSINIIVFRIRMFLGCRRCFDEFLVLGIAYRWCFCFGASMYPAGILKGILYCL